MLTPRPWTSSPQSRETRLRFCCLCRPACGPARQCQEKAALRGCQSRHQEEGSTHDGAACFRASSRTSTPNQWAGLTHSCALSGGFRATPPELSSWENGRPTGAQRATPAFHRPTRTCDGGAGAQLRHLPGGKHITCYCQVISPFWEMEGCSRPQERGPWAPTRKPRTRLQLSTLTQPLRNSVCGTVALTASRRGLLSIPPPQTPLCILLPLGGAAPRASCHPQEKMHSPRRAPHGVYQEADSTAPSTPHTAVPSEA